MLLSLLFSKVAHVSRLHAARCREIEIENEKLLSRMLRMETHIKAHEAPSQSAGSLNFVTRKRDFLRIVKENEVFSNVSTILPEWYLRLANAFSN